MALAWTIFGGKNFRFSRKKLFDLIDFLNTTAELIRNTPNFRSLSVAKKISVTKIRDL